MFDKVTRNLFERSASVMDAFERRLNGLEKRLAALEASGGIRQGVSPTPTPDSPEAKAAAATEVRKAVRHALATPSRRF